MKFFVPNRPKRNYGAYVFFYFQLAARFETILGHLVQGVLSHCRLPMWLTASEPQIFLAELSGMRSVRNRVPDEINCRPLTYRTLSTPNLPYIAHPSRTVHCPPLTYRTLPTPHVPHIDHPSLTVHCPPLTYVHFFLHPTTRPVTCRGQLRMQIISNCNEPTGLLKDGSGYF